MKNFKPLALSAAVVAATAGFAGAANAQAISAGNVGDIALVPYYTVRDGMITGVHIVNTTDATQVVKLRFRRGLDSMDALDFNLIMSPRDEWVGFISGTNETDMKVKTGDSTCTAPLSPNGDGVYPMPVAGNGETDIAFNEGAMEGYIEIIGMAQTSDESQAIAVAAKHSLDGKVNDNGVPVDCVGVESNFFRNAEIDAAGVITTDQNAVGVLASDLTHGEYGAAKTLRPSTYVNTPAGALSVSYFIRNADSGVEMGGRAVHIDEYATQPMMSNQQIIINREYDPYGYFYPDLDGGSPQEMQRGRYVAAVRPALGVNSLINEWSLGTADRGIDTDWVVTIPGQYLMLRLNEYLDTLIGVGNCTAGEGCDNRDIPVKATIDILDREEDRTVITPENPGLVISPGTGSKDPDPVTTLPNEVNVITWSGGTEDTADVPGAFNSQYRQNFALNTEGAIYGWAELSVEASTAKTQAVCDVDSLVEEDLVVRAVFDCLDLRVAEPVPMIGFTGWRRVLPDQPEAEYGRLIDHSFVVSS